MKPLFGVARMLSAILLGVLTLLATFELTAWMVFSRSFAALEEIQGLLMIWFGLLTAVYCLGEGLHLSVDLLARRLPSRWQPALERFPGLAIAIFGALLTVHGVGLVGATENTLPGTGWGAALQYQPSVLAGLVFLAVGIAFTIRPRDDSASETAESCT